MVVRKVDLIERMKRNAVRNLVHAVTDDPDFEGQLTVLPVVVEQEESGSLAEAQVGVELIAKARQST